MPAPGRAGMRGAGQEAALPPLAGCTGGGTALRFWLVYATGKIVTSSLCFSIMLTYSGSSGHTLQKPLMTLQLCNLNSLCSCSGCQKICNPKKPVMQLQVRNLGHCRRPNLDNWIFVQSGFSAHFLC